ncbi:sigma-54-dependent Fis family transcriptional regulator [Curvibacter sp. CHRR-16]|uniref:sigma-54-dependent Fis family transcriptional regulator n=1 Tax=Curvibacter sp. CHRR-16 TaxID=2835872 RepID=UPI001BDB3531|nr:sigma-54-dependent Fis family transcriptional regulator [Curvibacter sp. CHRR-16]MBT0570531.1 sigma-54-dependent Fis family transcriptional regulator [Curvibacter sp. CHRR-16]
MPHAQYHPQTIWSARKAFFEQGVAPVGLVNEAVVRSWRRCSDSGHAVGEPVAFEAVERAHVSRLLQSHHELLEAAQPELADLAASVGDAGYAVLLTDQSGSVLSVDGAIAQRSVPLRLAFRPGVDLSEAAIGTTAMSVAVQELQPVRVLGAEHFFIDTQMFHCSAAPVFDAHGNVIAAVDVSRDMPGMVDSTLWLAARCAQRIERRLFRTLRASVHVEIDAGSGSCSGAAGSGAWLAFGDSGELIAANRAARSLIGLPSGGLELHFDQLFVERFGSWMSALRRCETGVPLRLQDGVRLLAIPLDARGAGRAGAPPARTVSVAKPSSVTRSTSVPEFGDVRLMREFERALRAVAAGLPLLVSGETGTGKEVTARALHAAGARSGGPFVALNCAALPGELLASELFGYVEGAFTGARRGGAAGKIEAANGGTLFLDEIGDMPLPLQVSLLRVLDGKEVVRLGCHSPRPVDVSLVCATHRDLAALVQQGQFREDLMYRLCGHTLHLLPLRERRDFDTVLNALLERFGGDPSRIDGALRTALRERPWRGNLRQLANAVQRAVALADPGSGFTLDDFGDFETKTAPDVSRSDAGLMYAVAVQAIDAALQRCGGNVTQAAQLLGMGRATLYRKLKQRSVNL